ncbi:MAG: hypothetical protein V3R87_09925 [Dehalococcoidia bacterium]
MTRGISRKGVTRKAALATAKDAVTIGIGRPVFKEPWLLRRYLASVFKYHAIMGYCESHMA